MADRSVEHPRSSRSASLSLFSHTEGRGSQKEQCTLFVWPEEKQRNLEPPRSSKNRPLTSGQSLPSKSGRHVFFVRLKLVLSTNS